MIAGLQKMTLLDYPGKVAATVFVSGCNFRCPYCHNASLVFPAGKAREIAEVDLLAFLSSRKGLLDGVCVSGGEPLLWDELNALLRKIKEMGFLVKLDTNGSFPEKMKHLVESGLVDAVAMDVKHAPAKYGLAAGTSVGVLPAIRKSVKYLLTNPVDCEFRTTVVKGMHTPDDIAEIGRWLRGAGKYFLQNFVDSPDVLAPGLQGAEPDELQALLSAARKYVPNAQIRGV
ncbi:MAG: anaerobic ribonucleoside-triphosphate reductase activating protein [Clostridiales bacterium]|nr:anaerobic ribonucleoside-triphosphate reductase activating protein [Clostridiales bacterium]